MSRIYPSTVAVFCYAVVVLFLFLKSAQTQTIIDWTDSDGGNYNSAFSWAGFNIPDGVSESARFDGVNPGSPYNVALFFNRTVSDLLVSGGDSVTLTRPFGSPSDATYTIDDDVIVTGATLSLADTFASTDVNLDIGDELSINGGGTFNATDGSMVDTADLFVGRNAIGDGSVTVDGATLDVSAGSILGSSGSTGTVTFQQGATGNFAGTITLVSGSSVGNTGRFNVLSGSTIDTANIRVGSLSTSNSAVQEATLTVAAGSQVTQSGASTLTIGDADNPNVVSLVDIGTSAVFNSGTGETLVQNAGTLMVQALTGGEFNAHGPLTARSGGTIHVFGSAELNAMAGLDYSDGGKLKFEGGTITVTGGAFVPYSVGSTNNFTLGGIVSLNSRLTLGSGASADFGGNMHVGFIGPGTLQIIDGATAINDSATIGLSNAGSVVVEGSGSTWTLENAGTLSLAEGFDSGLTIRDGGMFESGDGRIGNGAWGNVSVRGNDSQWNSLGNLRVGNLSRGTLTITEGGHVNSLSGEVGAVLGSDSGVIVDDLDSNWTLSDDLFVGGRSTAAGAPGTVSITDGGRVEVLDTLKIWSPGTVTLDGGVVEAGTIDHTNGGTFEFTAGTLHVDTFEGNLTNQEGTLAPGLGEFALDTTEVTGDYEQQFGTLEIQIATPTNFDVLDVTGTATIAGTLDVSITNGVIPMIGDSYKILTAANVTGEFDTEVLPPLSNGIWAVRYLPASVVIEVVFSFAADFDQDGDVDGNDFLVWQRNPSVGSLTDWQAQYGSVLPLSATANTVPEPGAGIMLVCFVVANLRLASREH